MTDARASTVLDARAEPHAAGADAAVPAAGHRDDRRRPCTRSRCAASSASSRSGGATPTAEAGAAGRPVRRRRPLVAQTLRPFLWTHVAAMVPRLHRRAEFDLPVPCTYDFEVAAAKYLHALDDGEVPLVLLFSGTVFTRGATGFGGRAGARGTRRRATGCRSRSGAS